MSTSHLVRFGDLVPTPWKNGLGETRTIRSRSTAVDWSLSVATLRDRARYSLFLDTSRIQLALDPIVLSVNGVERVLESGVEAAFSGDDEVVGGAVGSEARGLNLMWHTGLPPMAFEVVDGLPEGRRDLVAGFVLSGAFAFGGAQLGAFDTVLFDLEEPAPPIDGAGTLVLVNRRVSVTPS